MQATADPTIVLWEFPEGVCRVPMTIGGPKCVWRIEKAFPEHVRGWSVDFNRNPAVYSNLKSQNFRLLRSRRTSNTTPAVPADLKGDILMLFCGKTQLMFAFETAARCDELLEEFCIEVRVPTLRKRERRACRPAYPAVKPGEFWSSKSLKVVALNVVWFQARC